MRDITTDIEARLEALKQKREGLNLDIAALEHILAMERTRLSLGEDTTVEVVRPKQEEQRFVSHVRTDLRVGPRAPEVLARRTATPDGKPSMRVRAEPLIKETCKTPREIADLLGCSVQNIYQIISDTKWARPPEYVHYRPNRSSKPRFGAATSKTSPEKRDGAVTSLAAGQSDFVKKVQGLYLSTNASVEKIAKHCYTSTQVVEGLVVKYKWVRPLQSNDIDAATGTADDRLPGNAAAWRKAADDLSSKEDEGPAAERPFQTQT